MKYNKVGVIVMSMAVLLMALPSTAVFAEDRRPEDNTNRNLESEQSITSTENDRNELTQEQNNKRGEADRKGETSTDQEETTSTGQRMSEEHRSSVSKFVQNLLKTADQDHNGIGEEVRKIANEEDASVTTTTEAIEKIEGRSPIKTFLIGTDYKNIGVIRSHIAKTQAHIDQLSRLLDQATTSTISSSTNQQLQILKQTEDKLAGFVSEHENKFSLFGWFVRLFSRQ